MAAMGRTGTKRLSLKKEGFELQLEREENGIYRGAEQPLELGEETAITSDLARRASIALSRAKESAASLAGGPAAAAAPTEAPKEESTSFYVTSPMVGTFY